MSDLIKREDAIREMQRFQGYIGIDEDIEYRFRYALNNIPKVNAEPIIHANWLIVAEQPYFRKHFHKVYCSNCNMQGLEKWNYCPNCGARIDKENKNV